MYFAQNSITVENYGPNLRNVRKTCILELLSSHKVESFNSMRGKEVESC
uniref:Uncharacterized protein n=1 Tax=Cucumis melo TaxID=3656 RepID=A0A9I9EFU8_CUCME